MAWTAAQKCPKRSSSAAVTAASVSNASIPSPEVVAPDLTRWEWKDEDEYAHVRRLGIVSDTESQAVDAARGEVLAMLTERSGGFAQVEQWAAWRWDPAWPTPRLSRPVAATRR
ncbi:MULTISPECIES: hypothetical protein [Streptomyces]|uniref:hypothetical protein n=1 Tax=Streptomyces TaxID=1883 RepID=UPI0035288FB5